MMKRMVTFILVLVMLAGPVITLAGPANKVTGNVTRLRVPSYESTFIFNAHEAKDVRPAKGDVIIEGLPPSTVYLEIQIEYVNVLNSVEAYFGGKTIVSNISNPKVGDYAMFYVQDNGEPGISEDVVYSKVAPAPSKDTFDSWISRIEGGETNLYSNLPMDLYQVIEGNLQIHFYE